MELEFIEHINNERRLWFFMRVTYNSQNFEEFEGQEMSLLLQTRFNNFYNTIRAYVREFLGMQSSILLGNGAIFNISMEREFENIDDYIQYTCDRIVSLNRGDVIDGLEGEWNMSGDDDFDILDARSGILNIKVGFTMTSRINFPDLVYHEDFGRELSEEPTEEENQEYELETEPYEPEYELDTEEYEPEIEEEDTDPYFEEIQREIDRLEVEINSLQIQKNRTTSLINDIERNRRVRRNRETELILSNAKENLRSINRRISECRRQLRSLRRNLNYNLD